MASLDSPAVQRRLRVLTARAHKTVAVRTRLRGQAEAWERIRPAIVHAGIDPAHPELGHLWPVSLAAKELEAQGGDSRELREADGAFVAHDSELARRQPYNAEAMRRAPRFAGFPPPELGASLTDWLAWALANPPPA